MFKLVSDQQFEKFTDRALEALSILDSGTGAGNKFLGWNRLPSEITPEIIEDYLSVVDEWIEMEIELVVVIGIGGSYLGAKAAVEALSHTFHQMGSSRGLNIIFAGQNLSEEYMAELMDVVSIRNVACVVISKSGTTTEPAIAFRLIKSHIEETYGINEARKELLRLQIRSVELYEYSPTRKVIRLLSLRRMWRPFFRIDSGWLVAYSTGRL